MLIGQTFVVCRCSTDALKWCCCRPAYVTKYFLLPVQRQMWKWPLGKLNSQTTVLFTHTILLIITILFWWVFIIPPSWKNMNGIKIGMNKWSYSLERLCTSTMSDVAKLLNYLISFSIIMICVIYDHSQHAFMAKTALGMIKSLNEVDSPIWQHSTWNPLNFGEITMFWKHDKLWAVLMWWKWHIMLLTMMIQYRMNQ